MMMMMMIPNDWRYSDLRCVLDMLPAAASAADVVVDDDDDGVGGDDDADS